LEENAIITAKCLAPKLAVITRVDCICEQHIFMPKLKTKSNGFRASLFCCSQNKFDFFYVGYTRGIIWNMNSSIGDNTFIISLHAFHIRLCFISFNKIYFATYLGSLCVCSIIVSRIFGCKVRHSIIYK